MEYSIWHLIAMNYLPTEFITRKVAMHNELQAMNSNLLKNSTYVKQILSK